MNIKPIKNKLDYLETLKEIEQLMMVDLDTLEGDRLDVLVTLVEAYELKEYPLNLPDPVEAVIFEMERLNLSANDLVPMIGTKKKVYEFLNKKRSLTLPMIRKLHNQLGIPAESLICESGK